MVVSIHWVPVCKSSTIWESIIRPLSLGNSDISAASAEDDCKQGNSGEQVSGPSVSRPDRGLYSSGEGDAESRRQMDALLVHAHKCVARKTCRLQASDVEHA